jgi:hypothetical protein
MKKNGVNEEGLICFELEYPETLPRTTSGGDVSVGRAHVVAAMPHVA